MKTIRSFLAGVLAATPLALAAACSHGTVPPTIGAPPSESALSARGPAAERAATLFVSPLSDPGRFVVLPATASGKTAPARIVSATVRDFGQNYYIAYDAPTARVWMTSCMEFGLSGGPVLAFKANAKGASVTPEIALFGKKTGLSGCQNGVAVDTAGNVYVADFASRPPKYPGGQIAIFSKAQTGNVAPVRRIAGAKAGFKSPEGIALDRAANLYVADSCAEFYPCTSGVIVFSKGASGNVAPVRTIAGAKTKIRNAYGVAVDAKGNLYVADSGASAIEVFAPAASGDVAPVRVIAGRKTRIRTPSGIAVDAAGYIYLGNFDQSTANDNWPVLVFAPNATGNVAPTQAIAIRTKRFLQPSGVAVR